MYKKIILLLSTILISLPLQACGASKVSVELSKFDEEQSISKDLTALIEEGTADVSPEVEFVNAIISDQKLSVSVSLVYHEQLLNEFLFVRDTIKEYLSETDYNISSLNLYSAINGSSDNLISWYSTDMNTGNYRNGVTDEMIMSCSLESLLSDDKYFVSTRSDTAKSQPASSDIEKPAMSELFKSVYLPYATREESFDFNSVIDFVNATEYEIEITEPTSEDLAQIKVVDANKDYVCFVFTPRDIEAFNYTETFDFIFLVSYYQSVTNSEVSFENYSEKRLSIYDRFFTHVIGENEIEVSSPDDQISFLFSNQ